MDNNNQTDSYNSGFIEEDPIGQHTFFTDIVELKSEGFNQLYTAERYGKKWLLKGLKKEYQEQFFYTEMLKKELDIMMSLSYPYIVQAFGLETVQGLGPCIIMEYVDGESLESFLKKGLKQKQKVKIVNQLLEALHYIHEKQIVHRDLKPANIMITYNGGNVKLIDFGLADTDSYSILKQPAGSLHYMSPEQQQGNMPDIRNDIYSMGRILEDMQLGRQYNGIIRRCLAPIDQRYSDSVALLGAFHHNSQKKKIAIVLAVIAVIVLFQIQINGLKENDAKSEDLVYKDDSFSKRPDGKPRIEFVDLGLSVKWATCNVGAKIPSEMGDYFAWGETLPKKSYSLENYAHAYCDKEGVYRYKELEDISGNPKYDAARLNWGAPARMPTEAECDELVKLCTWRRVTFKGVESMMITGPSGNYIFLLATGDRDFKSNSLHEKFGIYGKYWSSTPRKDDLSSSCDMGFNAEGLMWSDAGARYRGQTIRPVADK